MIAGCQCGIDQFLSDLDFTVPHHIENRLDLMGKSSNVIKPEHRSRTLDSMHGSKNTVYQSRIFGIILQFEKRSLNLRKMFVSLLLKNLCMFIHISILPIN